MGKLKLLGDVVEGGLNAIKAAKRTPNEQKAAEKYAAGAQYADPLEPATMRMSEALGNAGAEGKTLNFTEADRSRVFGSNRGGVGFSGLQHYSLPHKEANTVWGFGNKLTAEKKVKQNDPEKHLWTTFVGAPTQHKSNTVVLQDAVKEFQKAVKEGKVHPAQIKLMNDRIRMAKDEKTGALLFDDAYDLTDPSALGAANSFARRSAVGDVLLGEGVKGPMRRKAFKEEHGDQSWHDSGKMESVLKRETDPDLVGAETYDVGNRLFVMDNGIIHRPDLNVAFPYQVTGNDLGMKFQLTPKEIAMRDWMKQYEGRLDKKNNPSPVSYMDLARNRPSQFVDEDYLTFLQKMGRKKGGAVHDFDSQEASERVKARIEKYRGGGEVTHHWDEPHNVERFHRKMEMHKATGGLTLKPPTLRMAGGGMLGKGMAKLGKRLMADPAEVTSSIKGGTRKFNDEAGGNTVVKDVGGNWLRDSTGSSLKTLKRKTQGGMKPEDALVQMRERFSDVPEQQQNIRSLEADVALNKWVDSNLNNYVKKQMGTPEDPVRKLAEEDITHFPIAEDPAFWERRGESSRKKLGGSKMAQSDLAQQWENRTDAIIKRDTAQEHQSMMRQAPGMYEKGDEWINKLAPETPLYTSIMNPRDLGFDHIMDVLRADLQAGRIRPEQLSKVSIEQAVRRTYEYDQEMARKMAEAQFKVTEGMPVKKEYPEGYKWIELTQNKELPEGWTSKATPSGGVTYFDPQGVRRAHPNAEKLADALKYEGETMGHCVGSYCDDVARGRSRIFSLRDSKGEPHVTVETQPSEITPFDMPKDIYDEYRRHATEGISAHGGRPGATEWIKHFHPDVAEKIIPPDRIIQIKGKGNAKPKEDYLPFVQDFVRGDNWSDVGDFKNTGLEWHATGPKGIFGQDEVKRLEQAGYKVPKYLTNAEKDDLTRKWYELETGNDYDTGLPKATPKPEAPPAEGMANGGGVLKYTTLRNRNTTQSQPNRFADGGKSEMKATPRKKGYGAASDVLKGVHEFVSKPFGYENPPVELLSELLGIPAASRVLDKLSYGEPITNAGKANVPLIPDDTFDAATAGLGGLGAASKLAKPLAKAAKKLPKDLPVGLSIKSVGDSPFGEKMMPTARIGLEAPGILIPSKMNNVREAVRNTKGNYGARRVERAADEIPNLERMYQEDALKEAFTGDNASAMMSINPSDFEKFARELERKTSVGPKAAELAKQGDIDKMTVTTDEYIKHLQRLKDGFSDVPYLNLNKDEVGLPTMPKVIGHEGRHRNRALADAGEKSSLVKINPRGDLREGMPRRTQEDYIEALREELERSNRLVLPETDPWFRRPEIKLPDIYARGGPILKHTTLRNRRANQRVR